MAFAHITHAEVYNELPLNVSVPPEMKFRPFQVIVAYKRMQVSTHFQVRVELASSELYILCIGVYDYIHRLCEVL